MESNVFPTSEVLKDVLLSTLSENNLSIERLTIIDREQILEGTFPKKLCGVRLIREKN